MSGPAKCCISRLDILQIIYRISVGINKNVGTMRLTAIISLLLLLEYDLICSAPVGTYYMLIIINWY